MKYEFEKYSAGGKNLLILVLLTVFLCANLFGHSIMKAMAEEAAVSESQRYYTCVEIHNGDTLWSIAQVYAPESGLTTEEYVEVLKGINGIKEEVIHYGRYLTVMYTAQGH